MLTVAQLIREMVLLRDESAYVDSYLFRTTFLQGATGASLVLRTNGRNEFGGQSGPSGSVKCFAVGSEMESFAGTITSWSVFLESRLLFGFEEDADYFEATSIDSASKEPKFYFGHALRDGRGENFGCVIYSSKTASSHDRMDAQIGEFAPLCLARLMAPAQAHWISEFEKAFSVAHIQHSIFPIFGDIIRFLGHDINNHLATLSLQLQSLGHNSDSPSYFKTGISRSMQSVQRIDRSIQVLEAFSSIVLNESSTSFLENYIMATFETLKKDFKKLFVSVSVDQNFEMDRPISLDGSCLLFLIHNFLRTAYIVSPDNPEDPLAVLVHVHTCSQHSHCATLSVSADIGSLIQPVLEIIANRQNDKIGRALPPPVVTIMKAAKKLGSDYVVRRNEEVVTLELHLPLASS